MSGAERPEHNLTMKLDDRDFKSEIWRIHLAKAPAEAFCDESRRRPLQAALNTTEEEPESQQEISVGAAVVAEQRTALKAGKDVFASVLSNFGKSLADHCSSVMGVKCSPCPSLGLTG